MSITLQPLIAYTDGGCRGNPGPGGWGFILMNTETDHALVSHGGERCTTNNKMELMAAISALRALKSREVITVLSDSQYVIKCITEWVRGWKAKGWRKKDGEIKNLDLIQELDRLCQQHQVTWRWVKGHDGDRGNEYADYLTNCAMDNMQSGHRPDKSWRGVASELLK